jgi:glycogen debranching enzyme-like protein
MFDVNPTFLVRVRLHRKKFHVSRNRTVLQVNSEGIIARGSEDGFFVNRARLLSFYRYLINGKEPEMNVAGNVKRHSWLGYYISAPPAQKSSGGDQGSGQNQEPSQQTLELRVSRHVDEAVHEDVDLTNFTQRDVAFHFELDVESDFADQDELQSGEREQKGELHSDWDPRRPSPPRLVRPLRS